MNQVYFYSLCLTSKVASALLCLNPFMNQVYFYQKRLAMNTPPPPRLNPFMNQVYFYLFHHYGKGRGDLPRLNPFMNQVYFYCPIWQAVKAGRTTWS